MRDLSSTEISVLARDACSVRCTLTVRFSCNAAVAER